MRPTAVRLALCALLLAVTAPAWSQGETVAIRAGRIITLAGDPIENGTIVIRDGRIVSVAAGDQVPEGARVIDATSSVVMPGMVDSRGGYGMIGDQNEESSEITPDFDIGPAVDQSSLAMKQAAQLGITTTRIVPSPQNVVCGHGAIFKTAGGPLGAAEVGPSHELLVVVADDPGWGNDIPWQSKPTNFYFRQPTTRMGVVWMLRQALDRVQQGGATESDGPIVAALAGKLSVHVVARCAVDVEAMLRVADEFGITDLVFEECLEAYKITGKLVERGIPVIVGPLYGYPRLNPWYRSLGEESLNGPGLMVKDGVKVAIATCHYEPTSLLEAAQLAVRHGMDEDAALRAITRVPSEIIGLGDRVGTIEAGKDADLVILTGPPLAVTSRIEQVLVGGRVVFDAEIGADANG
jgi:imidazolonepropionase-like amidohydrolase